MLRHLETMDLAVTAAAASSTGVGEGGGGGGSQGKRQLGVGAVVAEADQVASSSTTSAKILEEEGLSDQDLQRFLDKTLCSSKNQQGRRGDGGVNQRIRVLAADELETKKRLKPSYIRICNTTDRKSGGEHWILLHIQKKAKKYIVNYFDPVGECLLNYHPNFRKFFHNYDMVVCNKGIPVQHDGKDGIFSSTCGMHCAFVAYLLCNQSHKYKSLEDVMKVYDISNSYEGVNYNECMTLYYMCNIYGEKMCAQLKKLQGCMNKDMSKVYNKYYS